MLAEAVTNIDDYEVFLTERMTAWSSPQRLALAAAIAERWLPAYESFSAAEEWGDPASLRRSLEAVWGHVQGHLLKAADRARHIEQINDVTPHMDDFDAEEALTACAVLTEAIRACGNTENAIPYVLSLVMGILESLVGEWPIDPDAQRRAWKKSAVRKELQVHWKIVEEIDATTALDQETVKALRSRLANFKLKVAAQPKPQGPPGLTNQAAFEQYRRYVESDIKGQVKGLPEPTPDSYLFGITYVAYWMGRYSRRMQTINGNYGRLADEQGQRALVARNHACDAAEKGVPEWDEQVQDVLEMCLQNNSQLNILDADTVQTPHAYGPSLRRLWLEGKRLAQTDQGAWKHVRAWASHRPAAWEAEDRRKKKGMAHSTPELGEQLARELLWKSTTDPVHPWATEVDGVPWRIRMNDFPDEIMYSLIIDSASVGDFHDWPETWHRSSF